MRRFLIAVVIGLGLVGGAAGGPAVAHNAGPCGQTDEPGHSEYAKHHVVALAHEGKLGAGGHNPGEHRGYSTCHESR